MSKQKGLNNENKTSIKGFKDSSSNWWLNGKHYHLNSNNDIVFICGGIETDEDKELLRAFIKRNKKSFKEREKSILDGMQKEYNSIITFGKFANRSVQNIFDSGESKYLQWLLKEYTFSPQQKELKTEIEEILK